MRKRNNQITIRLNPKHYKKLQKKAKEENMNISEFIRKTVAEAEFYDLPDEDYAEMSRQVRELYLEIEKLENKASYERHLSMEMLDKILELNLKIKDIVKHYYEKQAALGNSNKILHRYKWTDKQHRLCIRFNDEERLKLDKLLTRTFLKQNTVIQRLCFGELIPIKKPQTYYNTLKYINLIGDYRLNMMYQNAVDPNAAWDKICDIQDVRDEAMTLIRDFV